jgi:hypothetical protein
MADVVVVGDRVQIRPLPHIIGGTDDEVDATGVVVRVAVFDSDPIALVKMDGSGYELFFAFDDLEVIS